MSQAVVTTEKYLEVLALSDAPHEDQRDSNGFHGFPSSAGRGATPAVVMRTSVEGHTPDHLGRGAIYANPTITAKVRVTAFPNNRSAQALYDRPPKRRSYAGDRLCRVLGRQPRLRRNRHDLEADGPSSAF